MNKLKLFHNNIFIIFILLFICLMGFSIITYSADYSYSTEPYKSFYFDFQNNIVSGPQAYSISEVVEMEDISSGLKSPEDIFVSDKKNIYIADTGNNRVVITDQNWDLLRIIDKFNNNGQTDSFDQPEGVFVTEEEKLYVADTGNARVLVFNHKGEFLEEFGAPKTEVAGIIPEDFNYSPINIVVTSYGDMYALSSGSLMGLLLFDEDGEFRSFFGASRVIPNPLDVLWRKIYTEEQRKRTALFVPTQYQSIDVDQEGFLYVVEKNTVRKFGSSGNDLLDNSPKVNEVIGEGDFQFGRFSDVEVRENGIYSLLESSTGTIYTFNQKGHLLYAFGGIGNHKGMFREPAAITNLGNQLIVLDSGTNLINVFKPNKFIRLVYKAIDNYESGHYKQASALWKEVVHLNTNYVMAHRGMGRALVRDNRSEEALEHYKLAQDKEGYSKAYINYRENLLTKNFHYIIIIFLMVTGILLFISNFVYKKGHTLSGYKQNRDLVKSENISLPRSIVNSLRFSLFLIFHPISGFWELKNEKKGNMPAATIILFSVIAVYIFMKLNSGFVFRSYVLDEYNTINDILSILVPFGLWCIINWSLTTLFEGKATIREIYISTAYSLTPIVILLFPLTIISNFLTLREASFYYLLISFTLFWFFILLFFGNMTIHEYGIMTNLIISICVILGMGIVLFLVILFFALLDQVMSFINTIYYELRFR